MSIVNKVIFNVDTSIAKPNRLQILRGESVQIDCNFTNYKTPVTLTGMSAMAYWRSRAMAEESSDLWYSAEAEIVNGKVVWTWDTSNDDGSDGYEWFIKVTDANNYSYRAFGHIGMLGSPSTNPSIGPTPQSNYYTKDETDTHISQATEHLVPDTREINGHALNADVNLTASDVGALPDTYVAPVTSVNTKTGVVTLTASDVGALPDSYTAPVTSVNGKTGIVTLTASDVGAQTPLTFDNAPTANSSNPVTSDGIKTAITVNDSFSEWTFTASPSTGISNISAFYSEMESCWIVSATLSIDGQSIPVAVPTNVYDPNALSLTATFSGQETWVVSGTRELESRIIGNQTSKPLQPAGDYALKSDIPTPPVTSVNSKTGAVVLTASDVGALPDSYTAPVASVNGKTGTVILTASDVGAAPAGDYLPLSGGTVDRLAVDSADFSVRNLISVDTLNDGDISNLVIGSDNQVNSNAVPNRLVPIVIGNDNTTYPQYGTLQVPNIVIGNNSLAEVEGIVIGGDTGKRWEYDIAPDLDLSDAEAPSTTFINPTRHNIGLNSLTFVDENGDPVTSFGNDIISIYTITGTRNDFIWSLEDSEWGRTVQKKIGGRLRLVWTRAEEAEGIIVQGAAATYLRTSDTPMKLVFVEDTINSVGHSAASDYCIAIGNDAMAGAYITSGTLYQVRFAGALAVGNGAIAKDEGTIAIGTNSLIQGAGSIGIGLNAYTTASGAIQLGTGTNATPYSLQVGNTQVIASASTTEWSTPQLNESLLPSDLVRTSDLSGYAQTSAIPTAVSQLTNDTGYITASALGMLPLGTGTTLDATTLLYSTTLTADSSGTASVSVDDDGIPTGNDYYCFEMEIAVPVNTLSLTWPSGWAWVGEMPTAAMSEGKTIHLACRLDCREEHREITANAWEIA